MPTKVALSSIHPQPFDAWYGMYDEQGKPQGYARLALQRSQAGFAIDWELHLAFPGGAYEETRTMAVDRDLRLVAASYADGEARVSAQRVGGRFEGTVAPIADASKSKSIAGDLPEDGWTGMDFAIAIFMPLETGGVLERTGINEAGGFASLGRLTFVVKGRETIQWQGKPVETTRIERTYERGSDGKVVTLPFWVDDQRRLVQVDWGGGNLMVLSLSPTTHLFAPTP